MKKFLTLILSALLCMGFMLGAAAEEPTQMGEQVIVANLSNGNRLTFNCDTDKGIILLQYLSLPKNFSGSKYYTIGTSLTETGEASADLVLNGGGDGEFVLKYVGKQENEVNTMIKIGDNVKVAGDEGDVVYSTVKLSLVYGGVKKEIKNEGTVSVWIESENATILQSGADNVTILGTSSLIELTGEKESTDATVGTATSEAKTDKPFPTVLVIVLILLVIAGALAVMYFTLPAFKEKVDELINKRRPTKRR